MIIEVNYAAPMIRIIFQESKESTRLRREYERLTLLCGDQVDTEYLKRLALLPNTCGEIVYSLEAFQGFGEEIVGACIAAYLMIQDAVYKFPILDFLNTEVFVATIRGTCWTAHRKTWEVSFESEVKGAPEST